MGSGSEEGTTSRDERVLVVAPIGRDGSLACRVLREAGLEAETCSDLAALGREMRRGVGAVLLAQESLLDASIDELGRALDDQPPWSDPPFVVIVSTPGTTGYRAETLERIRRLRTVTFLDRPIRVFTLVSAIRAALGARRRQYEIRDLLGELQRSVRYRDEFLAMLSHELRNPLAAIHNAIEALQRLDRSAGSQSEMRAIIRRQVAQLTRLVNDLLDVSRVTSGKISLESRRLDLREVVHRVLADLGDRRRDHAIELVAPEPLLVDGDAVRLEQVVSNLVTNAIKYTPPGGTITVLLERTGDRARLRVRDTGIGMDPAMTAKVFELFTQIGSSIERSQGGLGIGLALVKRLVEMHGGTVAARSDGPEQGSEFVVLLPLAEAVGAACADGAPIAAEPVRPASRA